MSELVGPILQRSNRGLERGHLFRVTQREPGSYHPGLPKTEGFPKVWDLRCLIQDSFGQAGIVGCPVTMMV